jgi:hypothetical protein
MTAPLQVLMQSRCRSEVLRAAAVLGICMLLALAAVLVASASRARAQNQNMEEQGIAAAELQTGTAGTVDAGALPQVVAETGRLQKAGFEQSVDRVAWVDAAVRVLERLHPVAYTVEAAVPQLQPAGGRLQQRYEEAGLEAPQLERNDLLLRVQGLQEDELLDVLEHVTADGGGVVRIEQCRLARRGDGVGLDAECRLGRYSLHYANPEAAP